MDLTAKTVLIAGKISPMLFADVELFGDARGFSRSKVVSNALNYYVYSKQCVLCGAVNPAEGKHCAMCGARLFDDESIKAALEDLSDCDCYSDYSGEEDVPCCGPWLSTETAFAYLDSGIRVVTIPIINRKGSVTKYGCEMQGVLKDGKTHIKIIGDDMSWVMFPKEVLYLTLVSRFVYGNTDILKDLAHDRGGEDDMYELLTSDSPGLEDFNYKLVLDYVESLKR